MKRNVLIITAAVAVLLTLFLVLRAKPKFVVSMALQNNGMKSFKCNDIELLENGEFQVGSVTLRRPNGTTYAGSTDGPVSLDTEHSEVTKVLAWGTVKVVYAVNANRLSLSITTSNSSEVDTIQGLLYQPLTLRFQSAPKEYDGVTPLLMHSVGDVAVVRISYGSRSVAVVNDDVDKPLMLGFPYASNRPKNTTFPLTVHTDRVATYPDSYPVINRPIPPHGTDVYHISLRFGADSATELELAGDAYKRFGEAFPSQLNWPDRRPIGVVFLAADLPRKDDNAAGWLADPELHVTTPSGHAELRQRILSRADDSIAIMKDMNAQGLVTWDIEGQAYLHSVSYVCDPRMVNELAPEMAGIIDEYFAKIRNAGFRIGVCVKPQQVTVSPDRKSATQVAPEDPAQALIDKIGYAKKRWGITLAYIDSNTNLKDSNPTDAAIMQKVAAAFPDVLLIPEHSNLRYHSFSAPFRELRQGYVSTPPAVHAAYPKAFTVIYTADGPLDMYHKLLQAAVTRGDDLMYRTWYADPQNEKVKSLMKR
jgi:hypothetical protein